MPKATEFYQHFPEFTWDSTPEQISKKCDSAIFKTKSTIDASLKIPESQLNFQNAIQPLAHMEAEVETDRNIIEILFSASPNKEVRDAANEANKRFSDFFIEQEMRKDLYDLFSKVRQKETKLPPESERYLTKSLLYKKRNGLHLHEDQRSKIEALYKEIMQLCIEFNRNISEENVTLKFKKEDLEGTTDDFLSSLTQEGDAYIVTLKYPHVLPILKKCKVVSTRQSIEKAYNSRCIDSNVAILEKLVKLRHERAQILGYTTHADYRTEVLMSKNAKNVHEFLTSLSTKVKASGAKELSRLLELKEIECKKQGIPFDGKIFPYDANFYQRMVEELDFNVDHNLVREFFPFEYVTEKLLEIYQNILGLVFEKVEGTKTWHPEVTLYSVRDKKEKDLLGYFYLDLFPRPGKYTHAACFGIQSGSHTTQGPQLSCAAMIANFTKPLPDKPSLLTHDEVEVKTYFHEFGHVMHHLCSKTNYSMFHGTSVERDFVEAPSQMLENWAWDAQSLKEISCHYQTKKPLDDDLIAKLIKSRKANISLYYLRQIALSLFDYSIHTKSEADTSETYKKVFKEQVGYDVTPGTNFSAAFGHMCGEYDSQYYGYLWSQVYSCDMFVSRFKKEGIHSPTTGMSYRKCILEPGATQDGMDLLRNFLGRDPIQEPFLELAGILSDKS